MLLVQVKDKVKAPILNKDELLNMIERSKEVYYILDRRTTEAKQLKANMLKLSKIYVCMP